MPCSHEIDDLTTCVDGSAITRAITRKQQAEERSSRLHEPHQVASRYGIFINRCMKHDTLYACRRQTISLRDADCKKKKKKREAYMTMANMGTCMLDVGLADVDLANLRQK